MATSLSLLVCCRLPCVKISSVETGRTPVPICKPEGNCVCCEDCAPGWRMVWYSKSSNTARERLKPLVLTLARLLEMTSICVCCASRPVFEIHSERIMFFSSDVVLRRLLHPACGKFGQLVFWPRPYQLKARSWLALVLLLSAFFSKFMCISNCRARLIMLTIASTTLTLLPSSAPPMATTLASASAGLPSFCRNRPSSPRTIASSGGFTSLMRPSTVEALFFGSLPTADTVPSLAIATLTSGGMLIGPPSPTTIKPLCVCSTPKTQTNRQPPREKASLPSAASTAIQPLPCTATSSSR